MSKIECKRNLLAILSARPVLGRYHYDELPRCSPPRRGKWEFSLSSPAWKKLTRPSRRVQERVEYAEAAWPGGGCEGGAPLLKFHVCWDAAVCAVSADGFLYV